MGSGKSLLTKQPFGLGTRQSANIELDRFLRAPVNPDNDYMIRGLQIRMPRPQP